MPTATAAQAAAVLPPLFRNVSTWEAANFTTGCGAAGGLETWTAHVLGADAAGCGGDLRYREVGR